MEVFFFLCVDLAMCLIPIVIIAVLAILVYHITAGTFQNRIMGRIMKMNAIGDQQVMAEEGAGSPQSKSLRESD